MIYDFWDKRNWSHIKYLFNLYHFTNTFTGDDVIRELKSID